MPKTIAILGCLAILVGLVTVSSGLAAEPRLAPAGSAAPTTPATSDSDEVLRLLSEFSAEFEKLCSDCSEEGARGRYALLNYFRSMYERVQAEYFNKPRNISLLLAALSGLDKISEPANAADLIAAALDGMLASLDSESFYLRADNFRDMSLATKGYYGGVGIELTMRNGWPIVISPIDGMPAAKAGLQPNDIIAYIDGASAQGPSKRAAIERLRGPINSPVRLTIRRESEGSFEVTLTRSDSTISPVKAKLLNDIGYIRISQFIPSTEVELAKAIADLRQRVPGKLGGVILDLRNNPGGLLNEAVAVAGDFIGAGNIVSVQARSAKDTRWFNTFGSDLTGGVPAVVLINEGTASAAEIVAGALRDHRRALLLGSRSFGKGTVQTIIPLVAHDTSWGAISLTTAQYSTPSGFKFDGIGLSPGTIVKSTTELDISTACEVKEDVQCAEALSALKPRVVGPIKPLVVGPWQWR